MNMDELFGDPHDNAPISAEAQKGIAEMTQDFANTLTKPPAPMPSNMVNVFVNATVPMNLVQATPTQNFQYASKWML